MYLHSIEPGRGIIRVQDVNDKLASSSKRFEEHVNSIFSLSFLADGYHLSMGYGMRSDRYGDIPWTLY